jgi:hypothetical protein
MNTFYTLVAKDTLHSACKLVMLPARFREEVDEAGGLVITSLRLAKYFADQESEPASLGRFDANTTYAGLPLWVPADRAGVLRKVEELAVMLTLERAAGAGHDTPTYEGSR